MPEWIAPKRCNGKGGVYFVSAKGFELEFEILIEGDAVYLGDAEI